MVHNGTASAFLRHQSWSTCVSETTGPRDPLRGRGIAPPSTRPPGAPRSAPLVQAVGRRRPNARSARVVNLQRTGIETPLRKFGRAGRTPPSRASPSARRAPGFAERRPRRPRRASTAGPPNGPRGPFGPRAHSRQICACHRGKCPIIYPQLVTLSRDTILIQTLNKSLFYWKMPYEAVCAMRFVRSFV